MSVQESRMAKIKSIEAEVRSKVQEAVDEFVQSAIQAEGDPELDSDIQAIQIRIVGVTKPRSKGGFSSIMAKQDFKT